MRRAFTLIELLVVIAIIAVLCGLLGGGPGDAAITFFFGWVVALWRMIVEMETDWRATATFAVCLTLLTAGSHYFLRRLARHRNGPEAAWSWRRTFAGGGLVLVTFLAGISAVGLTHQSYWLSREREPWFTGRGSSHRAQSVNNLKQLGLAALNIHDIYKHFPPGGTFDKHGRGLHGWQTLVLPYIEQDALLKLIDLNVPWDDPKNLPAMGREVSIFCRPDIAETKRDGLALSHYSANGYVMGAKSLTFKDITDGMSNTLLIGEAADNFKPWGHPTNWRDPGLGLNRSPDGFGNPTRKWVWFVLADASVRRLSNDVSPAVLKAMATPAGGEKVEVPEW